MRLPIQNIIVLRRGSCAKHPKNFHALKGSSQNRVKKKIKLARVHERITNLRDFLHKLSTKIIKENGLSAEDLRVANMIKTTSWRSQSQMLVGCFSLLINTKHFGITG